MRIHHWCYHCRWGELYFSVKIIFQDIGVVFIFYLKIKLKDYGGCETWKMNMMNPKYKIFLGINKFLYINTLYINIISAVEIVIKTNFDICSMLKSLTEKFYENFTNIGNNSNLIWYLSLQYSKCTQNNNVLSSIFIQLYRILYLIFDKLNVFNFLRMLYVDYQSRAFYGY